MAKPHFTKIENVIIENIKAATIDIKIAVAWFNNSNIFNTLLTQLSKISITLLLSNDKNNYNNGLDFSRFISEGGKIFLHSDDKLMHNKYVIIDNITVITGSYNFTFGAEHLNKENVVVFNDDPFIAKEFMNDFFSLLNASKDVVDFNSEINKTENLIKKIFEESALENEFKIDSIAVLYDLGFAAYTIIEEYNLGNLETKGRAIVILFEDKYDVIDNQHFLKAAYLTFVSTGETSKAESILKKIKHSNIQDFKDMIVLLLRYKLKIPLSPIFPIYETPKEFLAHEGRTPSG